MARSPTVDTARECIGEVIPFLDARPVWFVESHVGSECQVDLPASGRLSLHCCVSGGGHLAMYGQAGIPMSSGMLVLCPPRQRVGISVPTEGCAPVYRREVMPALGAMRVDLGDSAASVFVSIYLDLNCGPLPNPFDGITRPTAIASGEASPCLRHVLELMDEIRHPRLGTDAMTCSLLKQLLIACLRDLVDDRDVPLDPSALTPDRNIARAYAVMAQRPGDPHTVTSLAMTASLSRSAFMARFADAVGCSPMVALRRLRMHRAAELLATARLSIDQVARHVGYGSTSSFTRAFCLMHGCEPRVYRRDTQHVDGLPDTY